MQAYKPLSFKRPSSAWTNNKQKTGLSSSSHQEEGQFIKETSSERMTLLHSRLQQEAEKIRKWKNATELEIQQKNHQIQTSKQLIDKQHKSLIEVQLQNESLKSRMEEEMANQKELQRKISSTREMCHALKDHVCKIEAAVEQGENDRKEIVEHSSLVDQQYMKLLGQFRSLEKEQARVYESLRAKIEKEKHKNEQLSVQLSELSTTSQQQIKGLQCEVTSINNQYEEMKRMCDNQSQQLEHFEEEKNGLEEKLKSKDTSLQEKETELNHKDKEITEKQVEIQELKDSFETLDKVVSNLQSLYNKGQECIVELTNAHQVREKELLDLQDKLEAQIQDQSQRITKLDSQLITSEKEKSSVVEEQSSLLVKLESSERKCFELENHLTEVTNHLKELQERHSSVEAKLSLCQDELMSVQSMLKEKESEKEVMKRDLEESLKEKSQDVTSLMNTLLSTETALSSAQVEISSTLLTVKEKEGIIEELSKEIESLEKKLKTQEEEKILKLQVASDEIAQNKNTEQELIKKNEDLKQELSNLTSKTTQKIDEMKFELESKNKSIFDLRLELSEMSSHSKRETLDHEKQSLLFAKEKKELEEKLKELNQELKRCRSKEVESKNQLDALGKEMALTLEKYQAENSHIVEQKDKDIQQLREANKHTVKEKEELEKKMTDLESEIKLLHQERKEDSAEDIEQYRVEIEKLKAQLQVKDEEIASLIVAASTLKAQVNSPRTRPAITQPTTCTSKQHKDVSSLAGTPLKVSSSRQSTPSSLKQQSTLSKQSYTTTPKASSSSYSTGPLSNNNSKQATPKSPSITERVAKIQEKRRIKEIHGEEDAVFKKPRTKPTEKVPFSGVQQENRPTIRNTRTSVTNKRTPRKTATANKNSTEKKGNLSWFDCDPIFGFLDD